MKARVISPFCIQRAVARSRKDGAVVLWLPQILKSAERSSIGRGLLPVG